MEADRVVVELIAKTDAFDGRMKQSASSFGTSMDSIAASAAKGEAAVTRAYAGVGQAQKILGSQINDVGNLLQSSKSPFTVISKQAPVSARAMGVLVSGATALGSVVGGLLVTSVISGGAALLDFILKNKDASKAVEDLIEKLKENAEQARNSDKAHELFAKSLDGVKAAADAAEKAIKTLKDQQKSQEEQTVESIRTALDHASAIRGETAALLGAARAANERFQGSLASADPRFASQFKVSSDRIEKLQKDLAGANAEAERLEKSLIEAISLRTVSDSARSEQERINDLFNARIDTARKEAALKAEAVRKAGDQAQAERIVGAELKKQTDELNKQRQIELEKARKKPSTADPKLPKVTQAEVTSLLKDVFGAGTQITSATRTAAQNAAAKGAANSYHLSGQAIDFVQPGGVKAFDKEMLRLAAEARGIKLIEILGPGDKGHNDHGHVAFDRRRQGPDQIAAARERQAQVAQRAADAEERRQQAYQNELADINGQVIDARQALVESAEEIARLETEAIEVSRKRYNDNLESLVKLGKLHQDEADELQKSNDERAKLRTELVKRREDQRKFRIQEADAQQKLAFQVGQKDVEAELLQSREGLATTARERHDLERRLIDIQFDQERLELQAVIASADRLKIELERIQTLRALSDEEKAALKRAQDESAIAQGRLASSGERQANAQTGNDRANATPLQSYFEGIPDTAAEINEAFESIVAGGLTTFTDALTDAIVNFRSLGDVGRAVLQSITAQLVRMAIQQVLLHTIGKTLGTTAIAATTAQAAAAGAAWAPAAAAASLATLGANAGPAAAALASTHALSAALSLPKGFRLGGYTGDGPLNQAAGIVHGQEYVFDAAATKRIGVRNLEAMRSGVRPSNATAAAPGGSSGGGFDASALRGIVQSAIEAMPPVNLYPTFDPVGAMEAALNTHRGRRVFADFLAENSGAMNGALQRNS